MGYVVLFPYIMYMNNSICEWGTLMYLLFWLHGHHGPDKSFWLLQVLRNSMMSENIIQMMMNGTYIQFNTP